MYHGGVFMKWAGCFVVLAVVLTSSMLGFSVRADEEEPLECHEISVKLERKKGLVRVLWRAVTDACHGGYINRVNCNAATKQYIDHRKLKNELENSLEECLEEESDS